MKADVTHARKVAMAVYLATDSGPAADISACVTSLADEVDRLRGAVHRLNEAIRLWGQTGQTSHLAAAIEPEGE